MRQTQAHLNAQMQEFCQKLFDKVDSLGYDVTIANQGAFIWSVKIENATEVDQYIVQHNPHDREWSWIRVINV